MITDRKQLATKVEEYLQELLKKELPLLPLRIHWDDCDCDDRRFWFHFQLKGLMTFHPGATHLKQTSAFIQMAKRLTGKQLDADTPYQACWDLERRPKQLTKMIDRRTYPDGYDTDTWVYVLSFYGAPSTT